MSRAKTILTILISIFIISGCGSATEVGNPTGEVPIVRTIKGTLDNVDLDLIVDEEGIEFKSYEELTVSADTPDGATEETNLDEAGNFSLDLAISKYYSMHVTLGNEIIGNFSFEQNGIGKRSNRLRINAPGEPIDFGLVRFHDGDFFPEYEPIEESSFTIYSEDDQGEDSDNDVD